MQYLLAETQCLQDYNGYTLFNNYEDAKKAFDREVAIAKEEDKLDSDKIYTENDSEFYFDGSDGPEKIEIVKIQSLST